MNKHHLRRILSAALCGCLLMSSTAYGGSAAEYPSRNQKLVLGAAAAAVQAAEANSGNRALNSLQQALGGLSVWTGGTSGTETAVTADTGPVTCTETVVSRKNGTLSKKIFEGPGISGSTVYMERFTAETDTENTVFSVFQLDAGEGSIRSFDSAAGTWKISELKEGPLPYGMYFIRTGTSESIFISPQRYISRPNGMIEYLPDTSGGLRIVKQGDRFYLTVQAPAMNSGEFCDFTALCSDSFLVDWNDPAAVSRWENYRFTDANRWCYDGYYYETPSTYIPYGSNYFYKLPAAYITGKMARNSGDKASRALALTMLYVMEERRNSSGFLPSENGSTWLMNSYDIEAGYFDTRFNTDLAMALLNAAESFGAAELSEKAEIYGKFLVSYAGQRHFTVTDPADGSEGWLVDDYWHTNGRARRTHVSLNHQAAEAVFLYRLAQATGSSEYAAAAERLVKGIEITGERWIMPDGNLYYSFGNDGTMISGDYPYLTYNDLLELQGLYSSWNGTESPVLAKLMESKLQWMNKNGITGYNR